MLFSRRSFSLAGIAICLLMTWGCEGEKPIADPDNAVKSKKVAEPTKKARQNLDIVVLGILAGLILKSAVDVAFRDGASKLDAQASWREVFAPFEKPVSFEFSIFLLTLLRFVYGAYRFHETMPRHLPLIPFVIDTIGLLGVFLGFYLAGMNIGKGAVFYKLFALFHAWDLFFALSERTSDQAA